MKLHRLVLKNYRGIDYREIDFPDHGVVVVSGANEIGKSSMVEALDLLLESRDRSNKKEVKQVKPTHADVGAEVTAEISAGAYRFVYHKRFHKKCETQLTVLEPRREQHSGDEAHDRVQTMLAETVDTGLWHAQRVVQSASTGLVNLSGCDALTRALDLAAGDAAALSGAEPLLIERIDNEYARYFTPTGRPTGEWTVAIKALDAAEHDVERRAAAVAEVDDRVKRHAALSLELAELAGQQTAADARQTSAQSAADAIALLTEQVREAELVAAAATATSTASNAAHAERVRMLTETGSRATVIAALEAELSEAAEAEALAGEVADEADDAVERADGNLGLMRRDADVARQLVDNLANVEEARRLAATLAKIDAALSERDDVAKELSTIAVDQELLREIEHAAAAVERFAGHIDMISATVQFVAESDIELVVDGQRVVLPGGQTWSTVASSETAVAIPGVVTARVTPGASAIEIQQKVAAAAENFAALLTAGRVTDLAAARAAEFRRRELQGSYDRLTASLAGLTGDEDIEQMRSRCAQLQGLPEVADGVDAAAARAELLEAVAARAQAEADCDTHRKVAAMAMRKLNEITAQTTRLQDKLVNQQAELLAVSNRLAEHRAGVPDAELAAAVDANEAAAQTATARAGELAEQLAAHAPDAVAAELAEAVAAAASLRIRGEQVERGLREIAAQLAVFETEGRKGLLDAAEAALEHAREQHDRIGARARAVQLLREVMTRHRDATRQRYVEPFRTELQRLGRPVFGPSFEVDIDSDLCILTRTLDGRTVPYESLSGGAKEQLGILARLAGAALVAKEDAVPILIDDALGFTDPRRLVTMAAVFDTLGERGQVIVLTCTPARYEGVKNAHRIELCA